MCYLSSAPLTSVRVAILRSLYIASIANHHYARRRRARFLSPPAVPILTPPASQAITIARVATVRAVYHSPPALPFTFYQHRHLSVCIVATLRSLYIAIIANHHYARRHSAKFLSPPAASIPYTSSITSNHHCACSYSASSLVLSTSISHQSRVLATTLVALLNSTGIAIHHHSCDHSAESLSPQSSHIVSASSPSLSASSPIISASIALTIAHEIPPRKFSVAVSMSRTPPPEYNYSIAKVCLLCTFATLFSIHSTAPPFRACLCCIILYVANISSSQNAAGFEELACPSLRSPGLIIANRLAVLRASR